MMPCEAYVKWLAFHYAAVLNMYGSKGDTLELTTPWRNKKHLNTQSKL